MLDSVTLSAMFNMLTKIRCSCSRVVYLVVLFIISVSSYLQTLHAGDKAVVHIEDQIDKEGPQLTISKRIEGDLFRLFKL